MTEKETLKTIREGILSGKCSDGNLAWIVNLCDESLAESGSANVGNAAAMRDALVSFMQLADDGVIQPRSVGGADEHCFYNLMKNARAALAAPARNCDVGTPEEQEIRWRLNCGYGIPNCKNCKVYRHAKESGLVVKRYFMRCSCKFIWAQMPYNESETNSEQK